MTDPFPKWRAQLARDGVLQDLPAITRGLANTIVFTLTGDFSSSTFACAVAASPDADTALASYTCSAGAFASGVTPITLTIAADAQGAIPVDGDSDGIETLVYDLLCTPSGGEPYRMAAGYQPISGGVT